MLISTRQTRKGDWLVFEAILAKTGIGVEPVGQPAGGYTTGLQFNRFPTEEEAGNYAGELATKTGGEVVDWQPPAHNVRFVDLPRLYPEATEFATPDEAAAAGWVYITPSKTIEWCRGVKIACADITAGKSFGYDLAIMALGEQFAASTTVWINGKFSPRFKTGDIVDAIHKARAFIDSDLITQAEAAKIAGIKTQAINQAIRDGRLDSFTNPDAEYQRRERTLVSRRQALELRAKRIQTLADRLTFVTRDGDLYVNLGKNQVAEAAALLLQGQYGGHYLETGDGFLYFNAAANDDIYRDMYNRAMTDK